MTKSVSANNDLPSVLCIMGPTASGKTSLAIETANALNGEVISVDSALVYKHMDIGTAKPSSEEKNGVAHHLIDIISPEMSYNVADFIRDAQNAIHAIMAKGKLPILAGGTMMYFNALVNGLNELPSSDPVIRQQISEMSLQDVHKQLKEVDSQSALRINQSDSQRLTRALEVYMVSGKSLTVWQGQQKKQLPFNFSQFSIMPSERSVLHTLIAQRFDKMLARGLVQEVEQLLMRYSLEPNMPSMRSVGYRQVWQYIKGEYSREEMRERGIIATRQLAKRQITWLRGWQNITPLESGDHNNLQRLVQIVGAT
ncbi:MAG: tRNA dimethylallyltransferase [Alphaproteobacteria bacterium]|jgi:tRNA dimethylallyltransferase